MFTGELLVPPLLALEAARAAYGLGPSNTFTANLPSFSNCSAKELVKLNTLAASMPSTARIAPRISCAGDVIPGAASGAETCDSVLTLLRTEIDITIASTPDFCVCVDGGGADNAVDV